MQNSFLTSKDLRKFALYISNSHSIPIWIILYLNLLVLGVNFTKHLIDGNNGTLSYMGWALHPGNYKKTFRGN